MRLIDADVLEEYCKRMIQENWNSRATPVSWKEAYTDFLNDVRETPTATQNNVISCVDCAYFSKSGDSTEKNIRWHCAKHGLGTFKNGFCHYAERRDF